MREIKFRAWDKKENKMWDWESDGLGYVMFDTLKNNKKWLDNNVLMQYTGLKDKNGKEIYEGDIVKTKHQGLAQVIWCNDFACFATLTIDDVILDEKQFCMSDIENIIGNIYENPELLNK